MRTALALATILSALTLPAATDASSSGCARFPDGYAKARCVVYATFPAPTEAAALRVVGCETGYSYSIWSYNRSSAATGYFQVLQGNAGRVLSYGGQTLTIPSGSRLFNPWVNSRVALFLSHGGSDWGEWSCQP